MGAATVRGRWSARRAHAYLTQLYAHFELVMAPSQRLAEHLRAWGIPRVEVQPLGVDCAVFKPEAADFAWRKRLCRQLGLPPDTWLLVWPLIIDQMTRRYVHLLAAQPASCAPAWDAPTEPGAWIAAPVPSARALPGA